MARKRSFSVGGPQPPRQSIDAAALFSPPPQPPAPPPLPPFQQRFHQNLWQEHGDELSRRQGDINAEIRAPRERAEGYRTPAEILRHEDPAGYRSSLRATNRMLDSPEGQRWFQGQEGANMRQMTAQQMRMARQAQAQRPQIEAQHRAKGGSIGKSKVPQNKSKKGHSKQGVWEKLMAGVKPKKEPRC